MIYIFDNKQKIIKVLTNEDLTAGHLDFKINTATTFEFSLPANKPLSSSAKFVAVPHPLDDSKFVMLRLTERTDNADTIDYSAYELAYQELATYGYIEDKRPQNQSALNLMKIALDGSNWELNNVNVSGAATTNFYYVDRLSAISSVVDLLGGEIVFYIEIHGNAISGRYMDYLARQGEDTSKVFANGSNLLTIERQSDTSGIYTAILPRGKGVETDGDNDVSTPDGYGRRLNIADAVWKKSSGKPLDKPAGEIILYDPTANAEWGQIDGNYRLLLETYDEIDDVNTLINSAYKTLQSVNHPKIQYSATVADVGGLSLGDTVLIMHSERDLSYKTRVFEVNYDLLDPAQTEISLGDDLSSNDITSQINSVSSSQSIASEQTQWTINQVGRNPVTFGTVAPEHPKVGDTFFKYLPNGDTVVYEWNGEIWVEKVSSNTSEQIAAGVDDAIKQAKSQAAQMDAVRASEAAVFQSEANAALSSAAAERAVFSSNATSMANSASAHADTVANSALSEAKSDLTTAINQEISDRNEAVQTVNSQAQSYVNQAKSDITDTINAISVGSRNLLLGTSDWSGGSARWNKRGTVTTDTYRGMIVASASSAWRSPVYTIQNAGILQVGNTYTFSTYIRNTSETDTKVTAYYDAGHTWLNAYTVPLPAHTDWTRVSTTFKVTKDPTTIPYGLRWEAQNAVTNGQVQFAGYKLETGNVATDWTPAPEDVVLDYTTKDEQIKATITQYQTTNDGKVTKAQTDAQAAVDGLALKVSKTDYDQKTGDLSTKINDVKQTADSSAQTIANIQEADGKQDARMSEIENTASGLKSTVSDLSTAQDKQSGYISELQQKADGFDATVTKVNNLSVGGRNLLLGSGSWAGDSTRWSQLDTVTNNTYRGTVIASTSKAWYSPTYLVQNAGILQVGKTYTFSTYVRNTSDTDTSIGSYYDYAIVKPNGRDYTIPLPAHTDWTRVSITFKVIKDPTTSTAGLHWVAQDALTNGELQLAGYKLEEGNVPTDWTPAPEDVDSATAKAQLTADKATLSIKNYKTDADGRIGQVQTDATTAIQTAQGAQTTITSVQKDVKDLQSTTTQTAGQVTTEIEDRKNGDKSVVTQMTGLIDQRITDTKKGYESAISQSANTIYANVSSAGVRYIRLNGQGNNENNGTYFKRIIMTDKSGNNVLSGLEATAPYGGTLNNPSGGADGDFLDDTTYISLSVEPNTNKYIQYDLGSIRYDLSVISLKMWTDTRTYYNVNVQVSADNNSWRTLFLDDIHCSNNPFYDETIRFGAMGSQGIMSLTDSSFSTMLTNHSGNVITAINGDTSGVTITGKQITLDGNTTVTGDFYAKGGNFKNLDASNITAGTLNAGNIKVINLDVSSLSGNITNFIKSYWNSAYSSVKIDSSGMVVSTDESNMAIKDTGFSVTTGRSVTELSNGKIDYTSDTAERIGYTGWLRNENSTVDYLSIILKGWHTTKKDDMFWKGGGKNFYGGDGIKFGITNANYSVTDLLVWNSQYASSQTNYPQGWTMLDDLQHFGNEEKYGNLNLHGHFDVPGSYQALQFRPIVYNGTTYPAMMGSDKGTSGGAILFGSEEIYLKHGNNVVSLADVARKAGYNI